MPATETQVTESEPICVDIDNPAELQRWAKELGVQAEELKAAARSASSRSVQAITEQLAKRSAAGPSS